MMAYGWDEEFVRKRITGAKGWAYYYYAVAQDASKMMQSPLDPQNSYGYQEIERLKHGRQ